MYFSAPTSSYGYYRGSPQYGGGAQAGGGYGPMAQGIGQFATGQGTGAAGQWSPTILYLLVLVIAEMVIFGFIARRL